MKPRAYQADAVHSIFRYFDKYKGDSGNPLIALPTGTGKSICIAYFLQLVYQWYPNQRVMMLTHVKELIEQNFDKLMKVWPEAPAGIYSAGLGRKDAYNMITFGGIGSVAKKASLFGKQDLILVDEAHLISPSQKTMYNKFFDELKKVNPYLKIIGLTATPYRLGFGSIVGEDAMFDDIVYDATTMEAFNWFLEEGYLLPVIPRNTSVQIDTNGVHMRGGDFIPGELQNAVNKDDVTLRALEEAMQLGEDRKSWLIFCAGVDHAIDAAQMLTSLGVPCEAVHSKISTEQRDDILRRFKSGELRAVTNNNVLTTGFDHPSLDLIVMLRPTASCVLWIQMLGRGTRPDYTPGFDLETKEGRLASIEASYKHNCLVLDYSGNTRRLGPINDPLKPKRPGMKGGGVAPVKKCEHCQTWNHASARWCGGVPKPHNMEGYCGAEFEIKTKLKQQSSTMALIKSDAPISEVFDIDHITYMLNSKADKPNTLKVTYHCGHKSYNEYICLLHDGWAGRKARSWWTQRSVLPIPDSIEDALDLAGDIKTATQIRVWTNRKYPEILAYCYDGTAFGDRPAPQNLEQLPVQIFSPDGIKTGRKDPVVELDEDDVPF